MLKYKECHALDNGSDHRCAKYQASMIKPLKLHGSMYCQLL